MRRLITIPISHYCERARWALDHAQLEYTEEQHLQLFHRRATTRVGGSSTPVLVDANGVWTDSGDIVSYAHDHAAADRKLYPDDADLRTQIEAFEGRVAHRFAIEGRRLVYWHFFRWGRPALRFNNADAPRLEKFAITAGFGVVERLMKRWLNVNDATAKRAQERLVAELDWIDAQLAGGRPYLFGDTFSAADLTLAALAAPLVLPERYGAPMPTDADLPDEIQAHKRHYRQTAAGRHALKMYEKHRRS